MPVPERAVECGSGVACDHVVRVALVQMVQCNKQDCGSDASKNQSLDPFK
jgi:hypothetical protein